MNAPETPLGCRVLAFGVSFARRKSRKLAGCSLLARQREWALVTGPVRSLSLKLSDTRVYEPQIRARLGCRGSPLAMNAPETPLLSAFAFQVLTGETIS